MKNIHKILFSLVIFVLVSFSSCKKDNSTNPTTGIVEIVTSGTWRITSFTELTENKTADFAGYTFTFNSNGPLIAELSGVITTGSWGWDDHSLKFHMSIGSSKPLSDLTDDWVILEKTENVIRLKNDNLTKDELVTFERN